MRPTTPITNHALESPTGAKPPICARNTAMAQSVLRPLFWRRDVFVGAAPATPIAAGRQPAVLRALLRTLLIVACAVSIGAAAWYGDPSGYLRTDAALSRLLRGMAAIKGGIAVAAIGAVLWRFGLPLSKGVAIGYLLGCCALAGATMLIWQLTLIPFAALLFHGAALGMLVMGWRDR